MAAKWTDDRRWKWSIAQVGWAEEQAQSGVPRIEQTVKAQTADGLAVEVNRFDFNLAYMTDRYVQTTDKAWIRARMLNTPAQG